MAVEATVRRYLGAIGAEIDRLDTTLVLSRIADECAATVNDYRATANIIRSFVNDCAIMPDRYKMTDGKDITERDLDKLRSLADDWDKKAASGYAAIAELDIAVDDETGEDDTTYITDAD